MGEGFQATTQSAGHFNLQFRAEHWLLILINIDYYIFYPTVYQWRIQKQTPSIVDPKKPAVTKFKTNPKITAFEHSSDVPKKYKLVH